MVGCSKCGWPNETDLDLHHTIPRFMGGKDNDGRLYLCKENRGGDCHRKLHKKLRDIIPLIKQKTEEWLKE